MIELVPDAPREAITEAIRPVYDETLAGRVSAVKAVVELRGLGHLC